MKIKEHRIYSDQEKRVLASFLIDNGVMSQYVGKWPRDNHLFSSNWANQIISRAKQYYEQHHRVPGKASIDLLQEMMEENEQESFAVYVEGLEPIITNQRKDKLPTHHSLALAKKHFDSVLALRIESCISTGKDKNGNVLPKTIKKAEELMRRKIEIGGSSKVYNLSEEVISRPREKEARECIVDYPDDIGIWLGSVFHRTAFVSFLGPAKSGKSYLLIDLAFRAVEQGRRVLFYELGDLGKRDHQHYLEQRLTCRPIEKRSMVQKVPITLSIENREGVVKSREKEKAVMTEDHVRRRIKRDGIDTTLFATRYFSSSEFTIDVLRNDLENEDADGMRPDVVVVDYADLMVNASDPDHQRAKTDFTWKQLRNIAHQYDCLVVTATQTKKEGYGDGDRAFLLGPEHFSDSRTKNDHVTAMIGINKTYKEEDSGVMRLNWVENRHDKRSGKSRFCYVAGVMAWANPIMISQLGGG